MSKWKQTQVSPPQGRANQPIQLERIIEAEEAPDVPLGVTQVSAPDDAPVYDWKQVSLEVN